MKVKAQLLNTCWSQHHMEQWKEHRGIDTSCEENWNCKQDFEERVKKYIKRLGKYAYE